VCLRSRHRSSSSVTRHRRAFAQDAKRVKKAPPRRTVRFIRAARARDLAAPLAPAPLAMNARILSPYLVFDLVAIDVERHVGAMWRRA
jgi:hypothetical protein